MIKNDPNTEIASGSSVLTIANYNINMREVFRKLPGKGRI